MFRKGGGGERIPKLGSRATESSVSHGGEMFGEDSQMNRGG